MVEEMRVTACSPTTVCAALDTRVPASLDEPGPAAVLCAAVSTGAWTEPELAGSVPGSPVLVAEGPAAVAGNVLRKSLVERAATTGAGTPADTAAGASTLMMLVTTAACAVLTGDVTVSAPSRKTML